MRALAQLVRHILFSSSCAACDSAVRWNALFCPRCAQTVVHPACNDAFAVTRREDGPRLISAFLYGGALRDAIRRMKFLGRSDLCRPLAEVAAGQLRCLDDSSEQICSGALWLPIPLTPSRLRTRGYNQAALLAVHLARIFAGTVSHTLDRVQDGEAAKPQVGKSRAERLRLSHETFRLDLDGFHRDLVARSGAQRSGAKPSEDVPDIVVYLVDDVCTTGATLRAAMQAIERAWTSTHKPWANTGLHLCGVTVAHAPDGDDLEDNGV
jgi:predicted amidophosphoribosyltransferase